MFSQSVKNAPGPDKLSFGTIWLFWVWGKERMVRISRAANRIGKHPAVCMRDSCVVIRKPRNDDYSNLKAYR